MSLVTRPFTAGLALARPRLFRVAALLAIVALFASACGGSSNKNSSTGATGTGATGSSASTGGASGASATVTAVTGSSSSSITGSPSGASTGPSGSTGAVASSSGASGDALPITSDVASLKSYNWEVKLEGKGAIVAQLGPDLSGASGAAPPEALNYDIKGAFIQPDQAQMELDTGSLSVKQTVIGTQEWVTIGGVTQGPSEVGASAASDLGLTNFFDVADIFRDVQGFDCSGSQNVNGVDTTVCKADMADYNQMAAGVAGLLDNTGVETVNDFSLQVYIAKNGGYVVKTDMTMSGVGTDNKDFTLGLHLDVTNINSVSEIKP